MLLQSCFNPRDYQTKEREIKSLLKVGKELKYKELSIITSDYEGKERIRNKQIRFIPLWKWLLFFNEELR